MRLVHSLIITILISLSGAGMAASVSTHIMFQGAADEAVKLYASVFPEFEVLSQDLHEEGDLKGKLQLARISFAEHRLIIFDSPPVHNFSFTPSMSLFVEFDDEDTLRQAFARLAEGGEIAMPLGDYGFSPLFGWVQDRFGLSWQLSLKAGE
jgi:predicted 3-demethylubiquinone-9 3-methyltransferase (glyoxalase superfamily)